MVDWCGAAEQYNLDRMDAEEDMDEEADETEINSNMLMNLSRDQQPNLITADFFRQAIVEAMTGTAGTSSLTTATVVSEVSQRRVLGTLGMSPYY